MDGRVDERMYNSNRNNNTKKISFSYTLIIILTVYNEVRSFKHKENRVAVFMEKIQKLSDPIGP